MPDLTDNPTVLVIDDEDEIIELIEAFIPVDASVRSASNASEALETHDEAVDLVFLDRRLPDKPGDEVLRRIRDRQPDCQVAMVSAATQESDPTGADYDAYVPKPFTPEDIEETTELLLSEH